MMGQHRNGHQVPNDADDRLDVAYTFDLVPPAENDTSETNVTMVRVNIADILPKKSQNADDGEIQCGYHRRHQYLYIVEILFKDYRAQGEATAVGLCGKLCSVRSCKCFTKIIFSEACYVDTYVSPGHALTNNTI